MEKNILDIFTTIEDPRITGRCSHKLVDILFIGLCTLLSNGEDFVDMVEFGKQREGWLRTVLDLPNGIPSHDTFNRVFQVIEPGQFKKCLGEDGQLFIDTVKDKLICLDGKKIKGENPRSRGNKGLYILNAWVSENKICIGQEKVGDKSNEITAVPKLLGQLNIEGAIVSIDAMGCQKQIAKEIISKQAGYLLAVKGNQEILHREIIEAFESHQYSYSSKQEERGHGRGEKRTCHTLSANKLSKQTKDKWKGVKKIIKLKSARTIKGATKTESRYYISSRKESAPRFNVLIREHWGVENNLHWHLDVTFNEDACRARKGHSPENLSIMRKIALHRLKLFDDKKSLKKKRFKASLNLNYLLEILLI